MAKDRGDIGTLGPASAGFIVDVIAVESRSGLGKSKGERDVKRDKEEVRRKD